MSSAFKCVGSTPLVINLYMYCHVFRIILWVQKYQYVDELYDVYMMLLGKIETVTQMNCMQFVGDRLFVEHVRSWVCLSTETAIITMFGKRDVASSSATTQGSRSGTMASCTDTLAEVPVMAAAI
mgnify:CR=1 FL=1